MTRTPVESSQIRSIGYEEVSQRLEIEFVNGAVYAFSGVPPEIHKALMTAESKGSFFGKQIKSKPERYPFTKLQGPTPKENANA